MQNEKFFRFWRYNEDMENRPWGYYQILNEEQDHKTKLIHVNPGMRLSYQRHKHRSEHWFFVSGPALVTIEGEQTVYYGGDSIDIPSGTLHRIEALQTPIEFIEVQTGTYFGEDDIERLDDDFGRAE